jgi:hypothetical protein
MEALRKVDRYGITRRGEQYQGWLALPESGGLQSDEEAARTLAKFGQTDFSYVDVLNDAGIAKRVYRAACQLTHGDHGGKSEDFGAVQTAWERLKMRHGL